MEAAPQPLMQIGEVADRTGLSLRTLRHWEEVGLITPSTRSAGGFRLYSTDDIARIELIKTMKPLALPLTEIAELADLLEAHRRPTIEHKNERLEHYEAETLRHIARIRRDLDYAEELLRTVRRAKRQEVRATPTSMG